ncbi:glutaredoxin family protein [Alkalicoccobacillus gibsonii]|uniref:glutaredoxin family protein n=1 Tax=Alkalicoccobacillus gibsonii TaxID=79881 RepID=UPI003F7BBF65
MSKEQSVIVWSKEGCHYCAEVKGYLDENQIAYQTIDVTHHDDRRDILEAKYGVRHVPVVEIGENHVYKGITKVGLQYVQEELAAVKK